MKEADTLFNPVEAVRRYHEAINQFDFDVISGWFAPDALYVSNGIGEIAGRESIMAAFRKYFSVFSDQVAEDDLIESLSSHAARSLWRLTATHFETGEISRRSGPKPSFSMRMERLSASMFRTRPMGSQRQN